MKYFLDQEFHSYFYKPLFGRRNHVIELISIGIVAEDGREYYAISKDFDLKAAWNSYQMKEVYGDARNVFKDGVREYWLRENVLKNLFKKDFANEQYFNFNTFQTYINEIGKSNKQISAEVKDFCFYSDPVDVLLKEADVTSNPSFYGYYADYDWVCFCSALFGRMIDLPKGFPMYCIDLKQNFDEIAKICMRKNTPDENVKLQEAYREAGGIFSTIKRVSIEESINILKSESGYPKQENEHNALDDAKWNKKLYEFLQSI